MEDVALPANTADADATRNARTQDIKDQNSYVLRQLHIKQRPVVRPTPASLMPDAGDAETVPPANGEKAAGGCKCVIA